MFTELQIKNIRKNFNGESQRKIFKILSDTNRYRIFQMLNNHSDLIVSDIANILQISIPLASQHLKILEHGGLVEKEKLGQKAFLKLTENNIIADAVLKEIMPIGQ